VTTVERKGDSLSMPVPVKVVFEDGSSQTLQTNLQTRTEILMKTVPNGQDFILDISVQSLYALSLKSH
jgi:hypothetical protein